MEFYVGKWKVEGGSSSGIDTMEVSFRECKGDEG